MTITDRGSRIVPCPSCGRWDCKDSRKVTILEVDTSKVTIDDTSQRTRVTRQVDEFLASEMSQEEMAAFMATHLTETPQEPAVAEVTGCTCGACEGFKQHACLHPPKENTSPSDTSPMSITVVVEQAGQQHVAQFDNVPIKTSGSATDRIETAFRRWWESPDDKCEETFKDLIAELQKISGPATDRASAVESVERHATVAESGSAELQLSDLLRAADRAASILHDFANWRAKANEYDTDVGHEPRIYCEDIELIEKAAQSALEDLREELDRWAK
jgi:hypothetical protein